ncbi:MAG TPA: acetylornithine deacetylase [Clostridiales bacterium]|nr:acetylornithine deacetylase [Clostridiales bacterium]
MLNHKNILDKFTDSELYQLTSELIKIPSYTGLAEQEKEIATFIHDFFKTENIQVEFQEPLKNRPNVIATLKGTGNGKSLMLTGHMDTVPPYNMINAPLSGEIADGKLYGRGACDMKGALACMMGAMAAIKRSGIALDGDLVFAGVINEEQKSEGTEYIVRNGPHTDAAIVGEPSGLQIAAGHRGLEWIEIDITGKTTHGGTPHEGINAISKAAKLITSIENDLVPKFKKRRHPLIGDPLLNFGVIEGGDQPSSVAGRCKLFIDRRWTPLESFDLIMDELRGLISDIKKEDANFNAQVKRYFADSNMMLHKPLEIDLNHPIINSLKRGIKISLGRDPEIISFLAWTDASLLSNYAKIPSVVFGPGHLKNAHSEDEFVDLSQLKGAYESYVLTAMDFCDGDIGND